MHNLPVPKDKSNHEMLQLQKQSLGTRSIDCPIDCLKACQLILYEYGSLSLGTLGTTLHAYARLSLGNKCPYGQTKDLRIEMHG